MGCESNGEMSKTFYDKKIGVFSVPYQGIGDMKLIMKSELHPLKIYLSYEFVSKKKSEMVVDRNPADSAEASK